MASPLSKVKSSRVSLVGAETLLGRELQDVIQTRKMGATMIPYAASGEGNFGEQEGETIYIEPLDPQSVSSNKAILVAGSPEGAAKVYALVKDASPRPLIIDCLGQLESQPEARILSPLGGELSIGESWLVVLAHPAAAALALVFGRLAKFRGIQQSVVNIFEPASERGKAGVSELHKQTTDLLSFKPLKKAVFDAQLSFNLLSQYGEQAVSKLSAIEARIERHLVTLLSRSGKIPKSLPSLRLVQAPVFHAYSMSAWVEFESDVDPTALGEALASAQIEVRGPQDEPPTGVSAASQSGLSVGDIRVDRNNSRAAWLWIVADNLRLSADAAADLLSELATGPN